MIQAEYYYRDELDEHGDVRVDKDGFPEYRTFDARVIGRADITASASNHSGGIEAMQAHLVDAWNRTFPDDPKTLDDIKFVATDHRW